jgi:hypothetical protein
LAVKARAALSWTVLLHKAPRLVAPGRISKQGDRYLRMLLTHGGPTNESNRNGGIEKRWH